MPVAEDSNPRQGYAYLPVIDDSGAASGEEIGQPRQVPKFRVLRLVVGALLATAGAALGARAWLGGGAGSEGNTHQHSFRHLPKSPSLQVKEETPTWVQGADFPSVAPEMDIDTEYKVDGGWGTNYDHIPDPEFCAAMCQGVPKCQAYTWVKDAGLDGCPSQCWLKDRVGVKVAKKGLVSGVPPKRKEVAQVPVKNDRGGKLYCFSLMVPGGTEGKLLKWQYEHKASIFGCHGTAIYSNKEIAVAGGYVSKVINSTLKCEYGGDSMSALNAWIFIALWDKLIHDGEYKNYDWVVKCDPDAVFFPDRLGVLLEKHKGAGYVNNCKYGMHGPIEVFSKRAIDALAADYMDSWDGKAPKKCVTGQHFGQWGEDMFIDQCLGKMLNVKPRPTDAKLMCESHCDCPTWYWCNAGADVVSYHPFKTVAAYKNCMANALER